MTEKGVPCKLGLSWMNEKISKKQLTKNFLGGYGLSSWGKVPLSLAALHWGPSVLGNESHSD